MHICGIDPGLSGALAVLVPDGMLETIWDTQTLVPRTSGTRQAYDVPGLVGLLAPSTGSQTPVLIEEAQAISGQGAGRCAPPATGCGWVSWEHAGCPRRLPFGGVGT